MQLDCQFVIFMKNKGKQESDGLDWSVTPQLVAVGNHWRARGKGRQGLGATPCVKFLKCLGDLFSRVS